MYVLIVDDQRISRLGVKTMIHWDDLNLTLAGEASNGKEAIEFVHKHIPDIVITDVSMPVMNGLELASIIAEDYPLIKIIIISGYNEFEFVKEALRSRVMDYILKPVDEQELNVVLSKISRSEQRIHNDTENGWSYPTDLEKQITQAIQWGEEERLNIYAKEFFTSIENASIPARESSLWINQLVLKSFKPISEQIPQELTDTGSVIIDSVRREVSLSVIRQQVMDYLRSLTLFFAEQKKLSNEKSILLTKTYIDEHYSDNLNLKQLASLVLMSPSHFSLMFKQIVGDNFIHYLTTLRLDKAKQLIVSTQLTIDQIAAEVGYPDAGYFRRLFKRMLNMTPLEYRRYHEKS